MRSVNPHYFIHIHIDSSHVRILRSCGFVSELFFTCTGISCRLVGHRFSLHFFGAARRIGVFSVFSYEGFSSHNSFSSHRGLYCIGSSFPDRAPLRSGFSLHIAASIVTCWRLLSTQNTDMVFSLQSGPS